MDNMFFWSSNVDIQPKRLQQNNHNPSILIIKVTIEPLYDFMHRVLNLNVKVRNSILNLENF